MSSSQLRADNADLVVWDYARRSSMPGLRTLHAGPATVFDPVYGHAELRVSILT